MYLWINKMCCTFPQLHVLFSMYLKLLWSDVHDQNSFKYVLEISLEIMQKIKKDALAHLE